MSKATEFEYSDLRLASIQSLAGLPPESPDGILFRSSGGRWVAALTGAYVALQRVSLSGGLHVSDRRGRPILSNRLHVLGDGNTLTLSPTYWTDRDTRVGTYSAVLKLVDLQSGMRFGDSGRFTFDFRVPKRGDMDGDNDIDHDDVQILEAGLGQASSGLDDPRDLNDDGFIDTSDLRILRRLLSANDDVEKDDDGNWRDRD